MQIIFRYIYCFIILCYCSGCKKFIEVGDPKNSITTAYVFADNNSAMAAVDGIYSNMANGMYGAPGFISGNITLYAGMSADELYPFSANAGLMRFRDNDLVSTLSSVSSMWNSAYSYIYQANACIVNLTGNKFVDESVRNRLTGEAKFIRAYCYTQLLQLFQHVPLVTDINYAETANLKNADSTLIYDFIISDLKESALLLSVEYKDMEKGRPNKWAANALLSKIYLYRKDWVNAELTADNIINNSGIYSLNDDPGTCFLKNNNEAIWQLAPATADRNTAEGFAIIPSTVPLYVMTDELLSAFEPLDKRYASWVGSIDYMGDTYYYPFKYKIKQGSPVEEYITLLRYSEQYLIRSEARAEQNNLQGATDDLNMIRDRAGLDAKELYVDKTDCLLGIEQERRIEFFAEQGHRWYDLKRTNRATAVLSILKADWNETDVLYPIPLVEINRSSLTQNEGY